MNGFDIKLLSQKTGIAEDKIWQILTRNPELKQLPYSFKAGKNRIFLLSFVDWLKKYEGISDVSDVPDKSVRNKTSKLTGALAREYRLAAEHDLITIVQFQQLIGLSPSSLTNAPPPPFLMLPEQISEEEKGVRAWTRNILNKRRRKDEDTRDQSKLDFDDN